MNSYIIATLPDRIKAEEAYTALEKAGIPLDRLAILGKGYKTADEFGFLDPDRQARKGFLRMAFWLIPFGFIAGYTFDLITHLDTFSWAGEPGNHIVGGFLGAIGGAMGSFFVGGSSGLLFGGNDDLPYRNRLNSGKYLVVVESIEQFKSEAIKILESFNPENLQNYSLGQ
jgi:hypothetical protein